MTHVLIGVPARAEDKALWEAVPGCAPAVRQEVPFI